MNDQFSGVYNAALMDALRRGQAQGAYDSSMFTGKGVMGPETLEYLAKQRELEKLYRPVEGSRLSGGTAADILNQGGGQ